MPVVLSGVSPENSKQLGASPLLREPAYYDIFIEIPSEGDFELGRCIRIARKGRAIGCVAFALPCLILAAHRR